MNLSAHPKLIQYPVIKVQSLQVLTPKQAYKLRAVLGGSLSDHPL